MNLKFRGYVQLLEPARATQVDSDLMANDKWLPEALRSGLNSFSHHFRADAISGEHGDVLGYSTSTSSDKGFLRSLTISIDEPS